MMIPQSHILTKTLSAHFAFIRFLPGVNSLVLLQISCMVETFSAYLTFIRLLPSVNTLMSL